MICPKGSPFAKKINAVTPTRVVIIKGVVALAIIKETNKINTDNNQREVSNLVNLTLNIFFIINSFQKK